MQIKHEFLPCKTKKKINHANLTSKFTVEFNHIGTRESNMQIDYSNHTCISANLAAHLHFVFCWRCGRRIFTEIILVSET